MKVSLRFQQAHLVRLLVVVGMLAAFAPQLALSNVSAASLPAKLQQPNVAATDFTNQKTLTHKGNEVGPYDTNQQIQLTIALKERDSAAFTQYLSDLYNPNSASYHKFITAAEYGNRFGPDAQTRQDVTDWLNSQGFKITSNQQNGSLITFRGTVAQAQNAFQVQINKYQRTDGTTFYANDRSEALPASFAGKAFGVVGLSNEVKMHNDLQVGGTTVKPGSVAPRRGPNNTGYTPSEYRKAYDIPDSYTGAGRTIAVYEVGFDAPTTPCYNPQNIDVYDNTFGIPTGNRQDISVDGQVVAGNFGADVQGEVELDIEIMNAIAPQAKVLVYCGAYGAYANSGFLDVNQQIASDNLADVASESYGGDEAYFIQAGIPSFLEAENNIFRQMAAQGQSMFTSAGDGGSTNDAGTNLQNPNDPAAQPYLTSVGGTRLLVNGFFSNTTYADETVWNRGTRGTQGGATGGGISQYWPESTTPWQKGPGVNNAFSNGGREYPDVSADADPTTGMAVYSNFGAPNYTNWYYVGGTSLSSPLVAAEVVDAVQQKGARVGLINPALYSILQNSGQYNRDFHDIIKGNNDPLCIPGSGSCDPGGPFYPATPGYDLATGVGTMDVANAVPDLINVNSGSYLAISNSLVGIGTDVGGAAVSYPITLTQIGSSAINYTSSVAVSTTTSWLTVTPASGTVAGNQSVSFSANPGSLAAGDYVATVNITGTAGTQTSNLQVTVYMTVGAAHVNTTGLTFTAPDTGPNPATQTVTVTSTSPTPRNYIVNIADFIGFVTVGVNGQPPVVYDAQSSAPVISVSSSQPVALTFGVDVNAPASFRSVFTPGKYSADVQLLSADFPKSIDQFPFAGFQVQLNLTGQDLTSAPYTLFFNSTPGGTLAPSQTFTVTDVPFGTAGAAVPVTATLTPAILNKYFTVTPTSSTVPPNGTVAFVVTPISNTLTSGTYNGNVTVVSGLNPQVKTVVNIVDEVQPKAFVTPSATSLIFTTTAASPTKLTKSIVLTATNGNVNVSASVSTLYPTPWLTVVGGGTIPNGGSGTIQVTVDASKLGPGAYNGAINISDNTNSNNSGSNPIRIAVLLNVVGSTGSTLDNINYPLPFLSQGAFGVNTFVTVQNIGTGPADLTVQYFNSVNGSLITTTTYTVPSKGQTVIPSPLPANSYGNAIISSNQPLNVLVTEGSTGTNGTSGSAYNVSSNIGSTLYDPVALNGAFGGFSTSVSLYNPGSTTITGTIIYFDQNGNAVTASANDTGAIAPHTIKVFNQAGDSRFNGNTSYHAVITSAGGSATALVTEQNQATKFLATFQATPTISKKLYVPTAYFNAFGSFNTGYALSNPNPVSSTVTITYLDAASGTVSKTSTLTIPAFGVGSSYTPASGVITGFVGAAVISSTQPLAVTVNEQSPAVGSGTYLALANGGTTVGLPAVANKAVNNFTTGSTLLNVSSSTIQVTLTYYNPDGTAFGPTTTYTVAPGASVLAYQGSGVLPAGFFGTVVLTSSAPNSLVATVNAASPGLFYTYTEPTP